MLMIKQKMFSLKLKKRKSKANIYINNLYGYFYLFYSYIFIGGYMDKNKELIEAVNHKISLSERKNIVISGVKKLNNLEVLYQ